MVHSIDKLITPQLISAFVIDSNVTSMALPTFSNGTTVLVYLSGLTGSCSSETAAIKLLK